MVVLCSEVAMSEAEKESEAWCKEMLNKLISEVKKQTSEMEDLDVRMNELAVGLKAIVQPRGVPDHALPPSVTAPTPTFVVAVDHAVAAATPRTEASLAAKSPTKCSMIRASDDTASWTFAFMPDVAPGPPSTAAPLDVVITSIELIVDALLVRDGTRVLTSTPSGAAVHSIDLGDEHVPNLSSCQLSARKVFDRMRGTVGISYGFSTLVLVLTTYSLDRSSTAGITVVDRAAHRREGVHRVLILARFGNSCEAMEFRQPWPPPTQADVTYSGVELCPMSWLSCKDYRGGVEWMPPWSSPMLGRMLTLEKGFYPAINSTEGITVRLEYGDAAIAADPSGAHVISHAFPHTYGRPLTHFLRKTANVPDATIISEHLVVRVGVVFCGRQSSGGHNVIWGLHEAIKAHNPNSKLIGFLRGTDGLLAQKNLGDHQIFSIIL